MKKKTIRNIFQQGAIQPEFVAESIAKHQSKTGIGAHDIFLGQVRADTVDNKEVKAIEFTAYEEMAKRTLGAKWKKISTEKQKEFVDLFQQFLTQAYAGNVDGYSGEQVEYLKERLKGDFAEVQTKVVSPKVQIPLDYRLLKKNDKWGVYDVIIDGVSLTKNYRGQFSRIIKSSSFEALLDKLRSKADLAASS